MLFLVEIYKWYILTSQPCVLFHCLSLPYIVYTSVNVVVFFVLNTMTLFSAAAQSPRRDQFLFTGAHIVFGYLI